MNTIEHIERVYSTKPVRYIVGAIEFLFTWCLVAVVVGLLITYFFPPARGEERIFIFGWDWRNLAALFWVYSQVFRYFAHQIEVASN